MSERWPTVFQDEVGIYDSFSRAEDDGGKLLKRLLSLAAFRGKSVLEIGCGTGKYIELIAPESRSYVAIDSSRRMIEFARRRCEHTDSVRFIHCNAEMLPIPSSSFDAVFASWVISGIVPEQARERAVSEYLRVLKPDGHFWLFENDIGGEFMHMRDPASARWDRENVGWMIESCGFRVADRVQTAFRFPRAVDARRTMGFILGPRASDHIIKHLESRIGHNVLIIHRAKYEGR